MSVFELSIQDPTPIDDWEEYVKPSKDREKWVKRTSEEVVQYRRDRVQYTIFRWLRDGQKRIDQIISDKIKSYNKQKESYNVNKIGFILTRHREHEAKLLRKRNRIQFYMDKSHKIDEVIKNYQEYTYEELQMMPDLLLHDDRGWRI